MYSVVYQAKYLQYYEQARKAFLREAECLALLEHNGCFSAVYKAQVNFKSPLGPDETFRVKTRVKVDGRKLTFGFCLRLQSSSMLAIRTGK